MNFASRSNRLIGQFVDGLIGIAPLMVAFAGSMISDTVAGILAILAVCWMLFYYFLADGLHGGQSYGKRWLGMRVVALDGGAPCTFGQSFVRNLLLAFLGPIDWIFIFGEKHQRLGDILAGTVVVAA